ncbi:MAG: DUF423 domain-containing protein [Nitrospira sp. CR1.3]|nr:DUF423 domain-containing protein [Nitrospira sp. CR1.3]
MISRSRSPLFFLLGGIAAGIGVAAGAFGAHSLKGMLDVSMLAVFETAVRYQMYHALGLCIVAWAVDRYAAERFSIVGWCFAAGILLFSGSLYGVALTGARWLGALTPLGGAAFITGWILFAWRSRQILKRESAGA